ncbi:hypothetical protein Tco_0494927 [Tanacetum coccineum]
MDEGFLATAYPEVQENLKLTVDEQMIPEEPVSSTGTLSSLQHLTKDFSYGDQFIDDKPSEANNEKTTADTEAESMVSVTIQQDTSVIPPMTSPVIDPVPKPDSPNVHWPLPTTTTTTAATTTTTLPLPPQPQQGSSDSILIKCMGELEQHIADLDSIRHDECEDFDVNKAQEGTKKKSKQDSLKTPPGSPPSPPPPPPPPSGASGATGITGASDPAQAPPPPPPALSTHQGATTILDDLYMDDETTAYEQAYSSGDEVGHDHIPTVNLRESWWKPLTEDRPATPEPAWTIPSSDLTMLTNNWSSTLKSTYAPPPENSLLAQTDDIATFMDWYCKRQGIFKLTPKDLEGPAYKIVKVFHPDVVHLQFQMEECHKLLTNQVDDAILRYNVSNPLPLGGEPGHVTIQPDFFFNKDLEYLRYGRKVGRPTLSISKMKAAYYPNVGLEQLVPNQF